MRLSKKQRLKIYSKYGGRCAYCGSALEYKKMQVDHYWPKSLSHFENEDSDRESNLMPSCQPCNIHKHGMRPETYREELGKQVERLMKTAQFKRALIFGQIKITESPIVFYFERLGSGHNN